MKVWELMAQLAKLPSGAGVTIIIPDEESESYCPTRIQHEEGGDYVTIVTTRDRD